MIPKKKSQIFFMLIMSFGMSVIMCAVTTAANTGIDNGYLSRFFNAWIYALPVAVIAAFTLAPIVRRFTEKIKN
tara:strand:+ start:100 stop:321 length:222 start_codon:yes stop_codon:yes gene_type:complete